MILSVGRLMRWRKTTRLCSRHSLKSCDSRPARLVILGEGSERGRLTEHAERLGLYLSTLICRGSRLNPFAYMSKSQVFVLSSPL